MHQPAESPGAETYRESLDRSDLLRSRLLRLRRIARDYWWVLVLGAWSGLVVQAWFSFQKPTSYESTSRLVVSGRMKIAEGASFAEESVNFFGTQMEIIRSPEVQQRAAARVAQLRPELSPAPVNISVGQQPQTSIFVISASGRDPEYIQAYLNALVEEYIAYRRSMFEEKSQNALLAIKTELQNAERELRQSEEALLEWQKENNLVFLREEGQSVGGYLTMLNRKLATLEAELALTGRLSEEQNLVRSALTSLAEELQQPNDGQQPEEQSGFLFFQVSRGAAASYLELKTQMHLLESRLKQALKLRRPNHPIVAQIQDEIKERQEVLDVLRAQALEQMESRQQSLSAQIQTLKEQIKQWEATSLDLSRRMGEYERLAARVERQKSLYNRLLGTIQNVDLGTNIQQDILSVLQYATPPVVRKRDLARSLVTGAFSGLALSAGLLLVLSFFDDRVTNLLELQGSFPHEVVGIIPVVSDRERILSGQGDDNPALAESFRKVRSWLMCANWKNGTPKSILVASSIPNEGKTTVCANLAVTFASGGAKVLVVDGDMRRGILHHVFHVESEPGLGNVLQGQIGADAAIVPSGIPNLWVLPRGHAGNRNSDVFLHSTLEQLLTEVETNFDIILFDSSPVLATDESSVLGSRLDIALVVVKSGFTSMRSVRRCLDQLRSHSAAVEGLIFNAVDSAAVDLPNYYYYYHAYSGKGEGAKKSQHRAKLRT